MTVFKTKKYSFEAVRFDGTNQDDIKEFGGDNVHVWPDGVVIVKLDHLFGRFVGHNNKYIRPTTELVEGEYLCKDENGYFTISDFYAENSTLIEPAITFHANEED